MKVIKFLAKHWILALVLVTVIFTVVLPNVEAELVSRGSDFINSILGGC